MTPKRISAYCRVSTDKDDQINSLDNQKSFFQREIEAQGHILHHIYADPGLSGTKMETRQQFIAMLHDAGLDISTVTTTVNRRRKTHTVYDVSDRTPAFDEIWIKNTSRFARNTLSYEIISKLRAKRVNIHFMSENIDTLDMSQDLLLKLMQIFDENESKDRSAKTKWGNEESAKRNRIRSHPKIYGYDYDLKNNALHIIPHEADVIRLIFDLYTQGIGTKRIINTLNARGLKTRGDRPFGKTQILRILNNEKYAGLNNPLKFDSGTVFIDRHYPKVKQEYAVMKNDRIEPIITVEEFEKAQRIRTSKINYQRNSGVYHGISPYCSLLYCAHCGAVYHSNVDDGRVFYNCSGKRAHGKTFCSNPNIPLHAVDDLIQRLQDGLYDLILTTQGIMAIRYLNDAVQQLLSRVDSDVNAEVEKIDAELATLNNQLERYYDIYSASATPPKQLLQRITSVQDRIADFEHQRKELLRPNEERMAEVNRHNALIQRITDMLNASGEHPQSVPRETVMSNLVRITVEADPYCKYRLIPELRFSREISDEIGTEDWIPDDNKDFTLENLEKPLEIRLNA